MREYCARCAKKIRRCADAHAEAAAGSCNKKRKLHNEESRSDDLKILQALQTEAGLTNQTLPRASPCRRARAGAHSPTEAAGVISGYHAHSHSQLVRPTLFRSCRRSR
jgi:hypothetical protein